MKKYILHFMVVIMTISLIGIITVQLFWIKNAILVKEAEYDENIREALQNIVTKIERKQAFIFISENLEKINIKENKNPTIVNKNRFIQYFKGDSVFHVKTDSLHYTTKNNINIEFTSDNITQKSELIEVQNNGNIQRHHINSIKTDDIDEVIVLKDSANGNKSMKIISTAKVVSNKVLGDMFIEYQFKDNFIENRINLENIDSIINNEIIHKNLAKKVEFAVINNSSDSIESKSDGFQSDLIVKAYKADLFPHDLVEKSTYLYLYLPDKNNFIYNSISIMLLGSVFFTLVIIIIFFFTIRIAFQQKKISEIKSDFINNMTHEFKTPIATISLATDSIRNPKIISDHERVNHYLNIIKEENKRMNNQVESVLQMSLLEKEKFKLNLSEYDVHGLIEKAVNNIQIQIIQQNGEIELNLHAENPFVLVDEIHCLNVIHNLLDNALKYAKERPVIHINTRNQNGQFVIQITDQGIGIKKEDLVRIFDKFYRVSTGNIHNVKGFGLGLSYVKAIVTEFNGLINATSEFDKGSQFEILLPSITENNGK